MREFKLEIRLFAYLRDGRGKKVYLDINEGTAVGDVLDTLGIPVKEASIMLINGQDAELSSRFKNGDYLSLFPPVGGG
jgi:molybdopterin converting factor small subunit